MASKIPPLLESYLSLPPETSLIVLTSILGASTNWLVLRYLHSYLSPSSTAAGGTSRRQLSVDSGADAESGGEDEVCVLLVSFMRDFAFWRDGASRLGVDLEALTRRGRFSFVDGLSSLYLPPPASANVRPAPGKERLTSPRIADVSRALHSAVDKLLATSSQAAGEGAGKARKVVLVVDQLDFLLASTAEEEAGTALGDMLLDIREKVHATILTLAADDPLVAAQTTALERRHAAFVLELAHEAEVVLSLRLLDTGAARDVSGVVRITRGGGDPGGREIEEREYLYHVGGDGGVKVFERGQ
ncbi:hypothetical protein NKR23_g1606 [Pleurostoma richardsiae]|uniref:Elongator complex protein 6 n=1 Tax=Pleurostoma richardsiae TaxID=41990 RepID=A0AA38RN86_9PEZI|nr:hypothetical protein NKR23_g1606 [Pleurostoma richardsiae]